MERMYEVTSGFQDFNGHQILVMKESSEESQGIHTTFIQIDLGLNNYKVDDKFLGRGMVVLGNQVSDGHAFCGFSYIWFCTFLGSC